MAVSYPGLSTHSDPLRLYKSEFTILPPRYGTLFHDDDYIAYVETETSRGGGGITAVGCAVERTREARALDYDGYCWHRWWYALTLDS